MAGGAPAAGSMLNPDNSAQMGKVKVVLDDLETELSERIREFTEQCRMIEEEDDRLMANSVRLKVLQCDVKRLAAQQADTQQKYEMAEARHREINNDLNLLNDEMSKLSSSKANSQQCWSDGRRDEMYRTATLVGEKLRRLDKDLNDTIAQINRSNEALDHGSDPISMITRTLNMQLQSLKWIESQSQQIEDRVNYFEGCRRAHQQ